MTTLKMTFSAKLKAIFELFKFRLSFLVAFSGAFGYYLALGKNIDLTSVLDILFFAFTGFCLTVSSVTVNQIIEKDLDALMKRTKARPLPTNRISNKEAIIIAIVFLIISLGSLLVFYNFKAFLLALVSFLLYSFAYTYTKRVGPISVFIGAIPGAFPPMIGYIAASNTFGLEPGILFAIQFFWQFPHFWALAWVGADDYQLAGFKMLPNNGNKDLKTAVTIMLYTIFLVPLGFIPYLLNMTGFTSAIIAVTCGVLFLGQTFYLMLKTNDRAALMIMFGSFLYLPVVQIAFLLDKN
jgi:heme o synthase